MGIHRLIVLETLRGLGKPGLAGALLLLAALAYGLAVALPAREEVASLQDRKTRARATLAQAPKELDTPSPDGAGREDAFYQALPSQAEVTQWVERIYDRAAAEQLSLVRGEYVLAPVADTRLVRYQIFLPMRGDYVRIQHFIAAALAAVPGLGLGLEDLSLQRQAIGDTQVEVLVRFSLYLAK